MYELNANRTIFCSGSQRASSRRVFQYLRHMGNLSETLQNQISNIKRAFRLRRMLLDSILPPRAKIRVKLVLTSFA